VPRTIDLAEGSFVVRYSGLAALARLTSEVRVRYEQIRNVSVGLDELPQIWSPRIGITTAPLGRTRRGIFWSGGERLFMDFANPRRAVVLDLDGHRYKRVAIEPESDPQELANELRRRMRDAAAAPPT
jgi:hypothetical protein